MPESMITTLLSDDLRSDLFASINAATERLEAEAVRELHRLGETTGLSVSDLISTPAADRPVVADTYNALETVWVQIFRAQHALAHGRSDWSDDGLRDFFGKTCRLKIAHINPEIANS